MEFATSAPSKAFQSTPSAWRETVVHDDTVHVPLISIHSLRMEGDLFMLTVSPPLYISIHSLRMEGDILLFCSPRHRGHFNPLPPHGGRLVTEKIQLIGMIISSVWSVLRKIISIHSLRMEGDSVRHIITNFLCYFNPLPPHGGRLRTVSLHSGINRHFNPLPPHGGRQYQKNNKAMIDLFQSTPSAWRETSLISSNSMSHFSFQSTPSAWRETVNEVK